MGRSLRESPAYVELIRQAKNEGANLTATLLTHVGWNSPDRYLAIHKGTSAAGREAFAAIGCPDIGPTGLAIQDVLNRVAQLAADQAHISLSRAIISYASSIWTGRTDGRNGGVPAEPPLGNSDIAKFGDVSAVPTDADRSASPSPSAAILATDRLAPVDRVELVSSEASDVVEYFVAPRSGEKARREESQLVKRFEAYLVAKGRTVRRARIRPVGDSYYLVTDTYDIDSNVLYEAKSSSDRATVRLAVGQLLDYLRYLRGASGVVLLPDEPSFDLQSFITACGLGVAYPREGEWLEILPPVVDA